MKHEPKDPPPRRHPRDDRRHYRQARQLKRFAAALVHAVPHSIIERSARA